jgi:hypothetical protein
VRVCASERGRRKRKTQACQPAALQSAVVKHWQVFSSVCMVSVVACEFAGECVTRRGGREVGRKEGRRRRNR